MCLNTLPHWLKRISCSQFFQWKKKEEKNDQWQIKLVCVISLKSNIKKNTLLKQIVCLSIFKYITENNLFHKPEHSLEFCPLSLCLHRHEMLLLLHLECSSFFQSLLHLCLFPCFFCLFSAPLSFTLLLCPLGPQGISFSLLITGTFLKGPQFGNLFLFFKPDSLLFFFKCGFSFLL